MFKEAMDWITLIASIFTMLAASATLYAVWLAHTAWRTWKTQQNYSFSRDKIFECELIVNKLTSTLINYITGYYHYRLKVVNNEFVDKKEYMQLFENQGKENNRLLLEYDLILESLDILKIDCDEKIIINRLFVAYNFDKYVSQINKCKESKELVTLYWQQLLPEMQSFRKEMLKELKKKRENL
jgi:uncharacterized membrane protein